MEYALFNTTSQSDKKYPIKWDKSPGLGNSILDDIKIIHLTLNLNSTTVQFTFLLSCYLGFCIHVNPSFLS